MGKYQKPPYYGTLKEAGREEDLRLAGEDQSPKKWVEAGTNYGSWQLIEVERTHRQPMFLEEQRTLLYYYYYYSGTGTKPITMIHTLQSCFHTLHTSLLFTAPFTALLLSHPLYRILLVRKNKVVKIKNWDKTGTILVQDKSYFRDCHKKSQDEWSP